MSAILLALLTTASVILSVEPTALRRTDRECKVNSDCIANAYCHQGKLCLCDDRFVAINTSKKTFICVNVASFIDDTCHFDVQCTAALGIHAECRGSNESIQISGKCQCKKDSHYQDGICYKNSRIGESCKVNDNCVLLTPNLVAYCDESRCVCPPYYHPNTDGTDCLPSSDLTGPCKSDEDCITMNSRCLGVCECKMGYAMDAQKKHCLIVADKLNDPCDEDIQCSQYLRGSMCDPISKRCNCSAGFHQINGVCYKTARLLKPCSQKEECLITSRNVSRVQCYNKFCLCADNHQIVNETDCLPILRSITGNSSWPLHGSLVLLLFALIVSHNLDSG